MTNKDKKFDVNLESKETKKAKEELEKKENLERIKAKINEVQKLPHRVIEEKNGMPSEIVTWKNGLPIKITFSAKTIAEQLIPFKFENTKFKNGLLPHLIKGHDEKNNTLIIIDKEVYPLELFITEYAEPSRRVDFRFALEALPISNEVFYQPFVRQEGGFFVFPTNLYSRRDSPLQKQFIKNLNIGKIEPSLIKEAFDMLKKHLKQWTLSRMIVGATIVNWLEIKDFLFGVKAIGSRDTGKSFAVGITNKICFGISSDFLFSNDALNSDFRNALTGSLTNLPVYIEEIKKDNLRDQKSRGKNFRGDPSQNVKIYERKSTLIFSANTDIEDINPDEQDAINKRIIATYFNENDSIPENEKILGDELLDKLKNSSGGLVFEKLKNKPIRDLKNKARELMKKNLNSGIFLVRMGEFILDLPEEPIDFGEKQISDEQEEFDAWCSAVGYRVTNAEYSILTNEEKNIVNTLELQWNKEKKAWHFKIHSNTYNEIKNKRHWKTTAHGMAKKYSEDGKTGTKRISINGRTDVGFSGYLKMGSRDNIDSEKSNSDLLKQADSDPDIDNLGL